MAQDTLPSLIELTRRFNEQLIGSLSDTFMNIPLLSWDDGIIGMLVMLCGVLGIVKIAPLLFSNKDQFFYEGTRFVIVGWLLAGMYGKIDSRQYIWDFNLPPQYDYANKSSQNETNKIGYRQSSWQYAYQGGNYKALANTPTIDRDLLNASAYFFDSLASAIEIKVTDFNGNSVSGGEAQKQIVDEMMLFLDQSRLARKYCTIFKGDKAKYIDCLQNVISPNLSINNDNQVLCGSKPCYTEDQLEEKAEDFSSKKTLTGMLTSMVGGALSSLTALTTDITGSIVFPVLIWILEFLKQVFSLGLMVLYVFLTAGVLIMFKLFAPTALISNSYANIMKANLKTILATTMFGFVMQFFQTFTTILLLGVKNATYFVVVNFLLGTNVTDANIVEFSLKAEALMNLSFMGVFIALFAQVIALFKVPKAADALTNMQISVFMNIGKEVVTGAIAISAATTALVGAAAAAAAAIPAIAGAATSAAPILSSLKKGGAALGASNFGQKASGMMSQLGEGMKSRASSMGQSLASSKIGSSAIKGGRDFVKANSDLYGDFLSRNVLGDEGARKLNEITKSSQHGSAPINQGNTPTGKDLSEMVGKEQSILDSLKGEGRSLQDSPNVNVESSSPNMPNNPIDIGSEKKGKSTTKKVIGALGMGGLGVGLGGFNALATVFETGMKGGSLNLNQIFKGGILKSSGTSNLLKQQFGAGQRVVQNFSNKALDAVAENPQAVEKMKKFREAIDNSYKVRQYSALDNLGETLKNNQSKGTLSVDNVGMSERHSELEERIQDGSANTKEINEYQSLSSQIETGNNYSIAMKEIIDGSASQDQYEEAYKMRKGYDLTEESSALYDEAMKNKEFAAYSNKKDKEVKTAIQSAQNLKTLEGIGHLNNLASSGFVGSNEVNMDKFDNITNKTFDGAMLDTISQGADSSKGLSMFNEMMSSDNSSKRISDPRKEGNVSALDKQGANAGEIVEMNKREEKSSNIMNEITQGIKNKEKFITLDNGLKVGINEGNSVRGLMFSSNFSSKQKEEKINELRNAIEDYIANDNVKKAVASDQKLSEEEAIVLSSLRNYLNKSNT